MVAVCFNTTRNAVRVGCPSVNSLLGSGSDKDRNWSASEFLHQFDRGHLFKFQIACLHFTYNLLSNSFCMGPQSVTQFLPSGASAWSWEAAGHEHGSQIQPR